MLTIACSLMRWVVKVTSPLVLAESAPGFSVRSQIRQKRRYGALKACIIRLTHTNVWESMGEALQLCAVYKKPYFYYYQSRENSYQVLISGIALYYGDTSKVHRLHM